jgi:hypothetical protein
MTLTIMRLLGIAIVEYTLLNYDAACDLRDLILMA